MPVERGVAANLTYTAFDFINQVPKTGDAGNHTLRLVRDGAESTPVNSPTEVDAVNLPGLYLVNLLAFEMNSALIVLGGKSATVGVSIIPTEVATE